MESAPIPHLLLSFNKDDDDSCTRGCSGRSRPPIHIYYDALRTKNHDDDIEQFSSSTRDMVVLLVLSYQKQEVCHRKFSKKTQQYVDEERSRTWRVKFNYYNDIKNKQEQVSKVIDEMILL